MHSRHSKVSLIPSLLPVAGVEPLPQGGGSGLEVSADSRWLLRLACHVTCLPPFPFPAGAGLGALWSDALEALLDPSWDILPGRVGGPLMEPTGIRLVCHLHTHSSVSPQSSCHASCRHHVAGELLVVYATLPVCRAQHLYSSADGSQSSSAGGAARGESKQQGSDLAEGSCFQPMMTMVVTITATGRELLPDLVSSHAFTHLILTAARGDEPRLRVAGPHREYREEPWSNRTEWFSSSTLLLHNHRRKPTPLSLVGGPSHVAVLPLPLLTHRWWFPLLSMPFASPLPFLTNSCPSFHPGSHVMSPPWRGLP